MQAIFNSFIVFISLFTATGVFVHEAHIDRVTAASANLRKVSTKKTLTKTTPSSSADVSIGADPHTHPEHGAKTLRGFSYKSPSAPPREHKMKKYLMQNHEPRGRHAFDNHHLPLVA